MFQLLEVERMKHVKAVVQPGAEENVPRKHAGDAGLRKASVEHRLEHFIPLIAGHCCCRCRVFEGAQDRGEETLPCIVRRQAKGRSQGISPCLGFFQQMCHLALLVPVHRDVNAGNFDCWPARTIAVNRHPRRVQICMLA